MVVQKVKKIRVRVYSDKSARKKHVESMFLTNRQKNYPFYFKDRNLSYRKELCRSKFYPIRNAYSVKVMKSGYVRIEQLKAIVRLFKWFVKTRSLENKVKLKLRVFPDFVLTSKPKEMRMGKGKGSASLKAATIKAGAILFSVLAKDCIDNFLLLKLVRLISFRVPLLGRVISNFW